jgi:DNA invertase Pin-like site-specific DNA recombinase
MASKISAVAYLRTSSAANVGAHKDSEKRQRAAVQSYAKAARIGIVGEYYDAAVSGADPVHTRPSFARMLERCKTEGIAVVLVESASRFARDLTVQLTGHALLQNEGIELVPVDAPSFFTDPTPTATMVRQILGAVSQFEKACVVSKLRHARDRIRAEHGRCEGRKPLPAHIISEAKRLYRPSPKTGKRRSLRAIASELARLGHLSPSGCTYHPQSVKLMLQP